MSVPEFSTEVIIVETRTRYKSVGSYTKTEPQFIPYPPFMYGRLSIQPFSRPLTCVVFDQPSRWA